MKLAYQTLANRQLNQLGDHAILEAKHTALDQRVSLYKKYSNDHSALQAQIADRVVKFDSDLKEHHDHVMHQCGLRLQDHVELSTELDTLKHSNLLLVQRLASMEERHQALLSRLENHPELTLNLTLPVDVGVSSSSLSLPQ